MADSGYIPVFGLQWQWHANPEEEWSSLTENPGQLRLYAVQNISQHGNLWFVPNLLLQKFAAPSFTATTRVRFQPDQINEKAGLVIMGEEWAYIALDNTNNGLEVGMYVGTYYQGYDKTERIESISLKDNPCFLRVNVNDQGICTFSYSTNGREYINKHHSISAVGDILNSSYKKIIK